MQQSYTKNYLKIYSMQILSVLLGFVSMFIVMPYLSSNKTIYGIYAICISVTIFFSYADLGFLGAAQKYAAESYSRNDWQQETSLLGFAHFIFLCMIILVGGIFLYLSFYPERLIAELQAGYETVVAHKLLLILSLFSPVIVIQRLVQMIFAIRLQEYQVQKWVIAGSIVKIMSVFYFFTRGKYDIVGYYLFIQIISALVAVAVLCMAKRKYHYPIGRLFRRFKFSPDIFRHTRSLAFSSLFVTFCWILYYEFDSLAIAKLLGADAVAVYAVGLSLLSFIRSLLSVLFAPFDSRFNHFRGLKQETEFHNFYLHVIKLTFPLVVFSLIAVAIMSKAIVISWVGWEYLLSVEIVVWLVLCNVLSFISYPARMMLMAREKIRQLYALNALMVLIFWTGIVCTINVWGVEAFARFKFLTFIINGLVSLWLSIRYLNISLRMFLRSVILPYLPSLGVMVIFLFLVKNSCISGKDKLNLFWNGLLILSGIGLGMTVGFLTVSDLKQYVRKIIHTIRNQ